MISLLSHACTGASLFLRRMQAHAHVRLDAYAVQLDLEPSRTSVAAGRPLSGRAGGVPCIQASGVSCEELVLEDGRRQILKLRLPGDLLIQDEGEVVLALTDVETVDARTVLRLLAQPDPEYQRLRRAWVAAAKADHVMQRNHIVRLGRLSAVERLAHLLAETHERLQWVGLAGPSAFHLPVRQGILADLLGLSVVHLSRVAQQLRRERLVEIRSGYVTVLDRERLEDLGCYARQDRASAPSAPTARGSRARVARNDAYAPTA